MSEHKSCHHCVYCQIVGEYYHCELNNGFLLGDAYDCPDYVYEGVESDPPRRMSPKVPIFNKGYTKIVGWKYKNIKGVDK